MKKKELFRVFLTIVILTGLGILISSGTGCDEEKGRSEVIGFP